METTTTTTNDVDRAYEAFAAADMAWAAELRGTFVQDAGDARYQTRGEGEPGTMLRTTYLAFMATGNAWRELTMGV